MPLFAVAVTTSAEWRRLALEGELDMATAPILEFELDRAANRCPPLLLIDLCALVFMDVAGLRVLIAAQERARGRDGELTVVNSPRIVQRLLSVAGVTSLLPPGDGHPDPFWTAPTAT